MADVIKVIDISKWQAGIKLDQWAAAGGLAVIAKASEGTTIRDANYDDYRRQCDKLGLGFASYHFFRPKSPQDQADWYLDCATPDLGARVICDWEDDTTTPDQVVLFLQRIQLLRPDLQLSVYSGHTAKDKLGSTRNAWLADNTSLWVAQYTTASSPTWTTATWPQWSLWQYSDKGRIPGFGNDVDSNRFNGPDANLIAWIGPAGAAPAPPVAGAPTVTLTLTSDQPVNLVVTAGANVTIANVGDT